MISLKKAVFDFRKKQEEVYNTDPSRIKRDTTSARKSINDHVGRWLFELIQNCDDGEATSILIHVSKKSVYVADNGHGFKPEAVKSISGTDYSDKPAGSIGRKGVGFKSVYQITNNPKIFTLNGEGLEFDPTLCKNWFDETGICVDDDQIPYQWIPFFSSRESEEKKDPILKKLYGYSTVVVLPFKNEAERKKALNLIEEWPPYSLFSLNHLQEIEVKGDKINFEISLGKNDKTWTLKDSRAATIKSNWRVHKEIILPPKDVLHELDSEDRKHVNKLSFIIAAPVAEDNIINPTNDFLNIHVFYPTEIPSPLRIFMHGEFLVKNDRTAIIPIDQSIFNSWISNKLAELAIQFINDSYNDEYPSKYLELLLPLEDSKYRDTNSLLEKIHNHAKNSLKLPDYEGKQKLSVSKSKFLSVTTENNLAYKIAGETNSKKKLLHSSFNIDSDSRKTLSFLGCKSLGDRDFVKIISNHLSKNTSHEEFIWNCLSWLSDWLHKKYSYTDAFKERKETIESITLFPANEQLYSIKDLEGIVITWKTSEEIRLPDWVPITILEEWFAELICNIEDWSSNILKLLKELEIKKYSQTVLTNGIKQAIDALWRSKSGNPNQIFEFLFKHYQDEIYDIEKLSRCPVRIRSKHSENNHSWVPVNTAYLGKEWNNNLIEQVFKENDQIYWTVPFEKYSVESQRKFLMDLGCVSYPRIREKNVRGKSFHSIEERYKDWLKNGFSREFRPKKEGVDFIYELDGIDVRSLSRIASTALITLIAENWDGYYCFFERTIYRWTPRSKEDYRGVISYWLYNLKNNLIPPIVKNYANPKPLKDCWLPDDHTNRALGNFLPIIDLNAFNQEADEISDWLNNTIHVCRTLDDLEKEDWQEIVCEKIPNLLKNNELINNSLRDDIISAYEVCAEALGEKPYSQRNLENIQLMCRKDFTWELKSPSEIYLADDSELSSAFSEVCWQLDLPQRYHKDAKIVFNLNSLSDKTEVEIETGKETVHLSNDANKIVSLILPYVFAWRCSKSLKQEELKESLTTLKICVVDGIKATVRLADKYEKILSKNFSVHDSNIYLNKSNSNKSVIALALADRIGVKTEADFYENLLRCNGDKVKLRNKLISKDMTEEILDRYLRDFNDSEKDSNITDVKINQDSSKAESKNSNKSTTTKNKFNKLNAVQNSPSKENSTFQSKDIENENIDFASSWKPATSSGNSNSTSTTQNSTKSRSNITYDDRMAIEQSGRSAAEKKLKEIGFAVEQMPGHNPGFDIKAKKGGGELRVEIKAHKSKASSIELTQAEYQEYIKCQELESVKWELWNIENLSKNIDEKITISRYQLLNEDAFKARVLTINLSKCDRVESEEYL